MIERMDIIHEYQTLVDDIALDKYKYVEIRGYEGRDPENLLEIFAYESKDSPEVIAYYHLEEKQRESVKEVAVQNGIEFEELPDLERSSKVEKEFEGWIDIIREKETDQLSHYERAVEFARELSQGVVRGYWRNEIAKPYDILDLKKNSQRPYFEFNVGRVRLVNYMIDRIGYGTRTGQIYTTKRGAFHFHGNDEAGDIDLMISSMVGIGMLKRVGDSSVYELTGKAFDLLRTEPTELEELSRKQLKVERRLLAAIIAQAVIAAVAALPQIERIISFIRSQQ